MSAPRNHAVDPRRRIALTLVGPTLFLLVWLSPRPDGLSPEGHATLAMAAWMAAWWLTVAAPLAVTALLPLALFPALGIASPGATAAPYANPVIFLFMGGFLIAAAMQRWDLHRRLALFVIARTGTSPRRLVAGFMVTSAVLSMWMSNTAATLMMMPIGAAVLTLLGVTTSAGAGSESSTQRDPLTAEVGRDGQLGPLGTALMLAIAYAGSIGGVATLIGTPPNAVLVGVADELLGVEISFARWLLIGLPISVVMLAVAWALLTYVLYGLSGTALPGADDAIAAERLKLGSWHPAERVTAVVFATTAVAWIFRAPKEIGDLTIPGVQTLLPQVGDATLAIAAAILLFLWPTRDEEGEPTRVLDWAHAREIPWDILVLFGGGLSLASAFETTGLTAWLGGELVVLSGLPDGLIITAVVALFVLLTEITSNTASATIGLPVVAALAAAVGIEPIPLMFAAAIGASMAFMLPVATPPNAIVFGTGYISAPEMRRAGIWLNTAAILMVSAAVSLSRRWLIG